MASNRRYRVNLSYNTGVCLWIYYRNARWWFWMTGTNRYRQGIIFLLNMTPKIYQRNPCMEDWTFSMHRYISAFAIETFNWYYKNSNKTDWAHKRHRNLHLLYEQEDEIDHIKQIMLELVICNRLFLLSCLSLSVLGSYYT